MKKAKMISGAMLLALALSGCSTGNKEEVNVAPSIVGVKGIQCIVNTTVDLLDGVAALDREDGDITPNMKISITPNVEIVDGYASFNKPGEYSVDYEVKDSQGRVAQKHSYIDVVTRENYVKFDLPNGFYYKESGQAKINKCGMINGEFVVEADGHEIAEDVQVKRRFDLKTNLLYTFKYVVESKCEGKVKVLADDIECGELRINKGHNILTFKHIVMGEENTRKNVEISLCFGAIEEKVDLKIVSLETEYPQQAGAIVDLTENFSFMGRVLNRFDGPNVEGNSWAENEGQTAVLEVTKASSDPGDVWRAGMFLNTGIDLKEGVTYTVSFDISNDEDKYFEVIIQRGQWDEYKFKTYYQPENGHYEYDVTPNSTSQGALWLYVQSGTETNHVRLSNLKVEEHLSATGKDSYLIEDFSEYHSDDFPAVFTSSLGGFKYTISKFAEIDSMQKVTSPTFYVNGSGGNYVLSFNARASKPIEVVVAAPVKGGWDPTILWNRVVINEKETNYTFFFNTNGADRDYTVVWQFGSGNNQKYEDVEIEVSDVSISMKNRELDGK